MCKIMSKAFFRTAVTELHHSFLAKHTSSGDDQCIDFFEILNVLLNSVVFVVCWQPRRVAAVTIAQRVASEMGTSLGQLVSVYLLSDD